MNCGKPHATDTPPGRPRRGLNVSNYINRHEWVPGLLGNTAASEGVNVVDAYQDRTVA
jgi:hypothetical protein